VHQGVHRSQGVLNYETADLRQLFTEAMQARAREDAYQAYRAGMDRANTHQLGNQRLYFDLTQRVPRMTLNGVEAARSHMVVRLPFADNDLVEFALTVPPGFLFERYLPRIAFARHFPALAKIPIAATGRPMISCVRDLVAEARELLAWHLRHAGLRGLAGRQQRPYKDYNAWFRGVLRPWVEDILLQPRALDRGWLRPEAIRRLVAAHMAGENHAVRLGALLTIELWHRQFAD
jgi:hypothetical protein